MCNEDFKPTKFRWLITLLKWMISHMCIYLQNVSVNMFRDDVFFILKYILCDYINKPLTLFPYSYLWEIRNNILPSGKCFPFVLAVSKCQVSVIPRYYNMRYLFIWDNFMIFFNNIDGRDNENNCHYNRYIYNDNIISNS